MLPPLSPVNLLFQLIPFTVSALRAGAPDALELLAQMRALARQATEVDYRIEAAMVTAEFLAFSKSVGNDLSTPRPDLAFPGLEPGDRWCLLAPRWVEAHQRGKAPRVVLLSTHEGALRYTDLKTLKSYALDLS